jgi:hypothetical protein
LRVRDRRHFRRYPCAMSPPQKQRPIGFVELQEKT